MNSVSTDRIFLRNRFKKRVCQQLKRNENKMPELPEVETMRRGLSQQVVGQKIIKIETTYPRMILTGFDSLQKKLTNHVITGVLRRGKYLIFQFDTPLCLISHLRMEGKYRLDLTTQHLKHDHISLTLISPTLTNPTAKDHKFLVYSDVRKFGTWELVSADKVEAFFEAKKIGPEPTYKTFDESLFYKKLSTSSKKIKPYLLEQTLVAGLGNIYADEVLFRAKIHPETPAHLLSKKDVHLLHDSIIEILQKAINLGGSTIRTYKNSFGKEGEMQNELKVYAKQNTACPNCGTKIKKIKLSGRGAHFCPHCQSVKTK